MAQNVNPYEIYASSLGLGVFTAIVRSFLSNEFTWRSVGRKIVAGTFVAYVVGSALSGYSTQYPGAVAAAGAMSAFAGDMILLLVLELVQSVQENPRGLVGAIITRFIGPIPVNPAEEDEAK